MVDALFQVYKNILDSYSGVYFVFWCFVLLSVIVLSVLENRKWQNFLALETTLFWFFGLLMVAFIAMRPFGIARDDVGYIDIYNAIFPFSTCNHWVVSGRDIAWYNIIKVLKSIVDTPRVMFFVSAIGLFIKLGVISRLSQRPLPVLLIYLSIFYQVQDATALRVSLAIAVFFLAILLTTRNMFFGELAMLACGFFHKQGFVAPLILIGRLFKGSKTILICSCLLLLSALVAGLAPDVPSILLKTSKTLTYALNAWGLSSHIVIDNPSIGFGMRNAPIVVYPFVIFMLYMFWGALNSDDRLCWLIGGCLLISCLFLWLFSWRTDAQVRFFEFFMAPSVLLVGTKRLNALQLTGLIAVSTLFVIRHNLLNQLFS